MQIHLLAIGTRMPAWINTGFREYASRLPRECALILHEIPATKRQKSSTKKLQIEHECKRLLAAIPKHSLVVALDTGGEYWSTEQLAANMRKWLQMGRKIALVIGGPDGLSQVCLERSDHRWSLSPLIFPHALVRVIVAEQIFRAWSIIKNHPYHRG